MEAFELPEFPETLTRAEFDGLITSAAKAITEFVPRDRQPEALAKLFKPLVPDEHLEAFLSELEQARDAEMGKSTKKTRQNEAV